MRDKQKTQRARELRRDMTDAERFLWRHLRAGQLVHKFRRQHPIGPYIVDFACPSAKLIVELDGGQHAGSACDASRDAFLRREGYRLLRFWNNDVLQNPEGALGMILQQLADGPR